MYYYYVHRFRLAAGAVDAGGILGCGQNPYGDLYHCYIYIYIYIYTYNDTITTNDNTYHYHYDYNFTNYDFIGFVLLPGQWMQAAS